MCKKISYSWLQYILYIASFGVIFDFFLLSQTPYGEHIMVFLLITLFLSWIFIFIKLFQDNFSFKNYFVSLFSFQNPLGSLHIIGNILSIIWMICSPIVFFSYFVPGFMTSLGGPGITQNIVGNILNALVPLALITFYFGGGIFFILHSIYCLIQFKKGVFSQQKAIFWMLFLYIFYIVWMILAFLNPFTM